MFPDSYRYKAMSEGVKQYKPFHLRWLLPKILKTESDWNFVNFSSLILLPPLTYQYLLLNHCNELQSLFGSALVCGLPGVYFINYYAKYLTDSFGMFMALASACAFLLGYWEFGILMSLIGSCANEKVFVYAALFSWNPLALFGGLAVFGAWLLVKPADKDIVDVYATIEKRQSGEIGQDEEITINKEALSHPLKTGIKWHRWLYKDWRQPLTQCQINFKRLALTWGVCLAAVFGMSTQLGITLAVAYGSMFLATDTTRIYSWAFPVLLISTVQIIPIEFAVLAVAVQWFNPVRKYAV